MKPEEKEALIEYRISKAITATFWMPIEDTGDIHYHHYALGDGTNLDSSISYPLLLDSFLILCLPGSTTTKADLSSSNE